MPIKAREPRKKYRNLDYTRVDKAKLSLLKGKKTMFSMTLQPSKDDRLFGELRRHEKNPDKISFGVLKNGHDRLELCAYKQTLKPNPNAFNPLEKDLSKPFIKTNPKSFLLFLNGESINLDIDDWRKLFRIMNKIGGYFNLQSKKRRKP